jgi:hypothetical protein
MCDKRHEERVEAYVQALLEAEDNTATERVRPCDVQKIIRYLKLRKTWGLGIPNKCLRHLPRRPLFHVTQSFNHYFRLLYFLATCKEAKGITLPNPGKDTEVSRPIILMPTAGKLFEN